MGLKGINTLFAKAKTVFFSLQNLPFSVDNKWKLLAMMCVFFGSGFGAPFFIVRHQLLKK
uniref:Cytochrome c oxidase subunit 7C, mitochondrial n=1 Tax=Serinus canaria TaxID=9135 RepID=A0A8C9KT81_SERCA